MTAVRHCRHCWGDCLGDCLLDDTDLCIHNVDSRMMSQLRRRRLRNPMWLLRLFRGAR
jgi:hypothetical protein